MKQLPFTRLPRGSLAFSILERIDVGETPFPSDAAPWLLDLSVSSNGSTWVKPMVRRADLMAQDLSVSSNGSTWVKLAASSRMPSMILPFSILERIDVGETATVSASVRMSCSSFSILERIDVGETGGCFVKCDFHGQLSVSSNGSTWVKLK